MSSAIATIAPPQKTDLPFEDVRLLTTDPGLNAREFGLFFGDFWAKAERESFEANGAPATCGRGGCQRGDIYALVRVDDYEEKQEGARFYRWENGNGRPLSGSFFLPSKPVQVLTFDPDQDQDDDLGIFLENGEVWFSYSILENAEGLTLDSDTTALTPDVIAWLGGEKVFTACFQDREEALQSVKSILLPDLHRRALQQLFQSSENLGVRGNCQSRKVDFDPERDCTGLYREIQRVNNPYANYYRTAGEALLGRGEADDSHCPIRTDLMSSIAMSGDIFLRQVNAGRETLDYAVGVIDGGLGIRLGDPKTLEEGYVEVKGVAPGSPAAKSWMEKGDRIVAVNGNRVGSFNEAQSTHEERMAFLAMKAAYGGLENLESEDPYWRFRVSALGPYGSEVKITVLRPSLGNSVDLTLQRGYNMLPRWFSLRLGRQEEPIPEINLSVVVK